MAVGAGRFSGGFVGTNGRAGAFNGSVLGWKAGSYYGAASLGFSFSLPFGFASFCFCGLSFSFFLGSALSFSLGWPPGGAAASSSGLAVAAAVPCAFDLLYSSSI